MSLEFPGAPVPLNSDFYIQRPPLEELAYQEISKPGSVIRIKAPRKMGKSSLMLRLIAHAAAQGYQTVSLDLQQADEVVFTNINQFLRWFCANVSRQLKIEPRLDEYWDEDIGSKVSCTLYFQGYLLEQIDSPLVLALNEVNRVFEYPHIAREFLPLLRSWHEEAKQAEILQKLRLVVVHSTEVYVSFNINQSPFNVGLPIQLSEFTLEQVQELARCYGLDGTDGKDVQRLMAIVGGHPYLVHLALYHLVTPLVPPLTRGVKEGAWGGLEQLLRDATTPSGIYSHHLRSQLARLKENPELAQAMKQVVTASGSVRLEAIAAYKLESMGLVKLDGAQATPSCELYHLYFQEQLLQEPSLSDRLKQLERENQELQRLSNLDDLTQLGNRRSFERELEQAWQRSVRDGTPLSLILCEIDYFKIYNQIFGHLAGDFCLQQIASVIREIGSPPTDFAARYQGEEFAVLLPQTDANRAVQVAEEIRIRVKRLAISFKSSQIDGLPASVVTLSLGVASTIPDLNTDSSILINRANEALSLSKQQERDCVSVCYA